MNVVPLARYSNRDTVSVLRCLLADAIDGEIVGVAVCFQTKEGVDDSALTCRYKARLPEAANAAMRLCWKINQAQEPPGH